MNEGPHKPEDAPPILAYANPVGAQPAMGKLLYSRDEHGVKLVLPTTARRMGGIRFIAWGLIGGGAAWFLLLLTIAWNGHWSEINAIDGSISSVVFLLLGALALLADARASGRRPLVIEVRDQTLIVSFTGVFHRRRVWPKDKISKFHMNANDVDLISGQKLGTLFVRSRRYISVVLLARHPHEECLWAAHVLREALGMPQD